MNEKYGIILYYFQFQFRRWNRHLIEFGIIPWIAYLLLIAAFVIISYIIFQRVEHAQYLYSAIAIFYMYSQQDNAKSRFMESLFSITDLYLVKVFENLSIAFAFAIFLIYKSHYLTAIGLMASCFFLSIKTNESNFTLKIPTPYSKFPYEFSIGFRKFYLVLAILGTVYCIGLFVENFNLSLVCILLIHFVFMSFYSDKEPKEIVWLHHHSPKDFLLYKIKVAFIYTFSSTIIFLVALCFFFPIDMKIAILLYFLTFFYIVLFILMKYAVFPRVINLPTGIIFFGSILFPPILLLLIPMYYSKSIQKLNPILT